MNITKAIIPVAGWGTRRLPITKTIEKCMLPVGNRPIVDYVVQDCIAAGINEIIFVVSEQSAQLQDYYRSNIPLNDYLIRNSKEDKLPLIAPLRGIKLHFVTQPSTGKYGTAVPVALAADYVAEGESVVVVMGDDCIYNTDGSSEIKRLLDGTPEGENGILGVVVNDEYVPRYGFIDTNENNELIRIVEHPDPEPERFIKNVSKYVFNYSMLSAIKRYVKEDNLAGEYGIFDPFEKELSGGHIMKLVPAVGTYLDAGNVESWFHANGVVLGKL